METTIIYHLSHKEVLRFGAFKRLIPDVNERVLSRALRELEENDIIHRHDFHENPPRVEYKLTQTGRNLSPIIVGLGNWGKDYNETYEYADMVFINQYDDDSC